MQCCTLAGYIQNADWLFCILSVIGYYVQYNTADACTYTSVQFINLTKYQLTEN